MKHALVGLPIIAGALASCVHAESVERLHAGMDRTQVSALLGPPETTSSTAGR